MAPGSLRALHSNVEIKVNHMWKRKYVEIEEESSESEDNDKDKDTDMHKSYFVHSYRHIFIQVLPYKSSL
jgi:hypothetical protein